MRQVFGIEFCEISKKSRTDIKAYVDGCLKSMENADPTLNETEDRRFPRIQPRSTDDVRVDIYFREEGPKISPEVMNISEGGAQCFYHGDYTIQENVNIHLLCLFIPNRTVECKGQVCYVRPELMDEFSPLIMGGDRGRESLSPSQAPQGVSLVVEDNPMVQAAVCRIIEGLGYDIYVADNAAKGLRLAAEKKPDLVVSPCVRVVVASAGRF